MSLAQTASLTRHKGIIPGSTDGCYPAGTGVQLIAENDQITAQTTPA
jgi:hypothetical protein